MLCANWVLSSLAVVVGQEPDDSACAGGAGFYVWNAQAYGEQYAGFLCSFSVD